MNSLILADQEAKAAAPAQLSFFEDECYELLESATGGHEFTGERLFVRDRRRYDLCVRMIAEGLATRQIARALTISTNTVIAVREREKLPVETLKQSLLTDVRNAAKLCVERVIELAPAMTGRDAAIASGIMIEKMQLLSGEATSIVGKEEGIKLADFNAMIEALPSANAREVPEIGLPADLPAQKGEPADLAAAAAPTELSELALRSPATSGDWQSPALQSKSPSANGLDNISRPKTRKFAGEQGGRGGSEIAPPGHPIDGSHES